jgi:protein NrfD
VAGALGVLAGGLLMRSTIFHAGNRSASRPQDYFGLTQPAQLPENRRPAVAAR